MSYRSSSDAYSRRPTGDDRRNVDIRDRRRESFQRSTSDSYKEDRYRRDPDAVARDRRIPSDTSRDAPSVNSPTKPPNSAFSARPDLGTRTAPSRSPTKSPDLDKGSPQEALMSLLRQHDEAIIEVARLRAERDPLDKVLKQRQAEYSKSMIKHAEFPSIPEVQNLHRVRYAERVRVLDAQIQKSQGIVDNTARSIAQLVGSGLPSSGVGKAAPVASAVAAPQIEAFKKSLPEIKELKSRLAKIESAHSQETKDLKEEFEKRFAEMKEQMAEMARVPKETNGAVATKKLKEEVLGEVRDELRVVRKDLEKQRSKTPEAVSTSQVSSLIEKESSALKADTSGLLKRVEELAGQLARNTQDTLSLQSNLSGCIERVNNEARKVEEHEAKLSCLDTEVLEDVAETMSIAFPDLQKKVAEVEAKAISQQSLDTQQSTLFSQVQQYTDAVGENMASLVDQVQTVVSELARRVAVLEHPSSDTITNQTRTDSGLGDMGKVRLDAINSELTEIKSEFDATKHTVHQLTHNISAIVNEDFKKQLATVRHSITVLDGQFNNLSTKALAEQIIGHLEQLYPNAHQLTHETDHLKQRVGALTSRIDNIEGRMGDLMAGGRISEGKPLGMADVPDVHGRDNESRQPSGSFKRRRTDLGPNGADRLLANGAE
ncbi:hypothetical protein B0J18DRAFT_220745 [Chaetomium sp. MPI-SDFR-AT-0129]|nr:hypothetical protein B0J18DRAFT_220745 [Chaetomium sp. MPI-SDFR-AT-0129]